MKPVAARASWCAVALALAIAGCAAGETSLTIDVKTDFAPRADFVRVESVVWSVDATGVRHAPASAWLGVAGTENFMAGVRVAELAAPAGTLDVVTTLVGARGDAVAERITRVTTNGTPLAITVLLTRSCAGVACGVTTDGLPQTCSAGRCVDPRCVPGTPACDAECAADADCTSGSSACTVAHCVEGTCFRVPDDTRCSTGEHCEVTSGCVRDSACSGGCDLVHATSTCTPGGCAITHCDPAWHDCNAAPEDGCECPVETCRDVLRYGIGTTSGFYSLRTRFLEDATVWCDMTTDGGGWSLLFNVPSPPIAGPVPVVDMVSPDIYGRLSDARIAALLDGAEPGNNVRVSLTPTGCCVGDFPLMARYPSYAIPITPLAFFAPLPMDASGGDFFGYSRYPEAETRTTTATEWSFTSRWMSMFPLGCWASRGCGGPDMSIYAQTAIGSVWAR